MLESGWYPELCWELESLSLELERSLWREGEVCEPWQDPNWQPGESGCRCWEGRWIAQPFPDLIMAQTNPFVHLQLPQDMTASLEKGFGKVSLVGP